MLFISHQNWRHRINRGEGRAISGRVEGGERNGWLNQGERSRETLRDWTEGAVATKRPTLSAESHRACGCFQRY